jgi:hypothetical protein
MSYQDLYDSLQEAELEERGRCDSCEVANINGVRCHEYGCPRYAHLKSLREQLERSEDY